MTHLRIVSFLEIRKQQTDEHRALLFVAHKSTDSESNRTICNRLF